MTKPVEERLLSELAELRIELKETRDLVGRLVNSQVKPYYNTKEFAASAGLSIYTVRHYARDGRLNAEQTESGPGGIPGWRFSHEELLRFQKDGPLPLTRRSRGGAGSGKGGDTSSAAHR